MTIPVDGGNARTPPDGAGHTIRNLSEECDRSQFLRAVELNSFHAPTSGKWRSIRPARTAAGKMSEVGNGNDGTRPKRAKSYEGYPSRERYEARRRDTWTCKAHITL